MSAGRDTPSCLDHIPIGHCGRALGAFALGMLLAAPAVAQDWDESYRAGLAALAHGEHARAAEALRRAIALHPEPGRNVLTYGTNIEPRYFPYLRLAEACLALGQLDAAGEAIARSASWGTREPADERQALTVRLQAAIAAKKPPASTPAIAAPTVVPNAAPTPAPAPTPVPTPAPTFTPPPAAAATSPASAAPSPAHASAPQAPSAPPARPGPEAIRSVVVGSPLLGSLEVFTDPAGASVYVDDEPVGSTDPASGRLVKSGLQPGRHRVRVTGTGHEDARQQIEVTAGATQTLRVALASRPAPPQTDDSRTGLLLFAIVAVAGVAAIAWLGLRRPFAEPARSVTRPSGALTDPGALATPRALVNPGVRVDKSGREWFGDYRLLEVLGRGGMASVFKAERRSEIVALKRPLATLLDNPEFLDRFLREAEIGRSLNHPNIVRILDRGNVGGVPYFTMELVPGETLMAYLAREGCAEPRFAARIVVQVAEALDFAHGKGVVHRDLKPSNVMLLPDGSAHVMDFGIARAERFGTLTATSAFLGTPHYVAPEMIEGPGAEARSDLYALGVVFFELLTGARPFVADTPYAILKKHCLEQAPPPSRVRPGVPPELDAVVLQLLRKTPAERPASAEALVIALRDFLYRAA